MVLQALCRYYDILSAEENSPLPAFGYSSANVSFALVLSPQGELVNFIRLFEKAQRGKNTVEVPLRLQVPEQVKRSVNIAPNFLCDNATYVLGLSGKNEGKPEYARKRFEAFRQLHLDLLTEVDCPAARAVTAFLNHYTPERELPLLQAHQEELNAGGNLIFRLEGATGYLHEDKLIRRVWEAHKGQHTGTTLGQCLVTGERAPIARLHASVKGIRDANPTGATLVGFNAPAYVSYNKSQGENSPVSERAAFAYTTALNYLLSSENPNRKFYLGDATVVYWAESADPVYGEVFAGLFGVASESVPAGTEAADSQWVRDPQAERLLAAIGTKISRGEAIDTDGLEGLNSNTRFYVLGLSPNAARISVRFFYQDSYLKTLQKITQHYQDMALVKEFPNQPEQIPPWQILRETVSRKSSDKKPLPLLAGSLLISILNNTPYPAELYYALLTRIRADADDVGFRKINYVRAAMIKAYLIRKLRYSSSDSIREVLNMSLNEKSTQPAYLLGRLFAVLEKVQQEAIGDVNASIKDRYFTSACAAPASVFPVLLRLSQHHIAKAEYGYVSDRRIEEMLNLLDVSAHPIPAHLTLDEQGIFILGYYHQRAAFFSKTAAASAADSSSAVDSH
ncbi:MAG: type I-C CRISPR-associated protein Cas8c/Csd1 [Anaerolineaceae bacterium]|nr:type I-C CRISPR-associated protein Cas8c/Csd1 [Anaerolineaceae bacterium]